MNLSIGKNIRSYRKSLALTQEQLAEAVGVTIGAVSKWESDLSRPDLELIIELADFFEVSVDVLLGYEWQTRSLGQTVARIKLLGQEKRYEEGAREAEKALQKFPNSFDIIYQSALLYDMMGIEQKNPEALKRALSLFQDSLNFISQNTDETISELALYNRMGEVHVLLGEVDDAIALFKKYNHDGINSGKIGLTLSFSGKSEEALRYLSESLLESVSELLRDIIGYVNCFFAENHARKALDILNWMRDVLRGLMHPGKINYANKLDTLALTLIALARAQLNDPQGVRDALQMALKEAKSFDETPDHNAEGLQFYYGEHQVLYDDYGESAIQGIQQILVQNDNDEVNEIFQALCQGGTQ